MVKHQKVNIRRHSWSLVQKPPQISLALHIHLLTSAALPKICIYGLFQGTIFRREQPCWKCQGVYDQPPTPPQPCSQCN